MDHSPKLKKIMVQINRILSNNDVAGVVVLHTPGFSEYSWYITPSYSCVKIESMNCVTFRAKAEHFAGDTKKRDQVIADTSNMLHHLSAVTFEKCVAPLHLLSEKIDKAGNIEHGESIFTLEK